MIQAALTFFLLALVASLIGASNAGGVTTEFGHFLLLVFLVLAIVAFTFGVLPGDSNSEKGRDDEDKIF